jgi:hypothetical protein
MAKFKQTQVRPGVTKTRSNAIKVYCSEAIAENDILVVTGVQGDFLQVAKADADGAATLSNALLFVADYAAAVLQLVSLRLEQLFLLLHQAQFCLLRKPPHLTVVPSTVLQLR